MVPTFYSRFFPVAFTALLLAGSAQAATGPGQQPAKPHGRQAQPVVASAMPATTAAPDPDSPQMMQLKGIVLNADGRPCAGASVYPAGAIRQLVVTDAQGTFTLPVPAGTAVTLQIEYFGVGNSRVTVEHPSAEPLHVTLGK